MKLARTILSTARNGALATVDISGGPFASYVLTAPSPDNSPILLLSRLALHTRNLQVDPRASLLFVQTPPAGSDSITSIRLTVTGRAICDLNPEPRGWFLAAHPGAALYSDFGDFAVYRFELESGHLVAGFGRIASLTRADLTGCASA